MLTQKDFDLILKEASKLYGNFELELISEISERVANVGYANTVVHNDMIIAQEMGIMYQDVINLVAKHNETTAEEILRIFKEAGISSLNLDDKIYKEAGLSPKGLSSSMTQLLTATAKKTNNNLKNLCMTTAETSQIQFYNAINKAYLETSTGVKSYTTAILDAIKEVSKEGAVVNYGSRKMSLEASTRMNILTGVNQTSGKLQLMRAEEMGWDLMEISAHGGARPEHAEWQGKIVSRSGQKGYLSLDDIGYGEITGFQGVNCRHTWFPYYKGSTLTYTDKELYELKNERVIYNGQEYTKYEASQIQRGMERKIRSTKKEIAGVQSTLTGNNDIDIEEAQTKLKQLQLKQKVQNSQLNDFIEQTKFKKDTNRLFIGNSKVLKKEVNDDIINKKLLIDECKRIIEKHKVTFVNEDLKVIDNRLLSDNTKQLDNLLNKYPAMKEYIKDKNMHFGAENFRDNSTVAAFSNDLNNKKLSINLSKNKYRDYDKFIKSEKNDIDIFHSMPCSDEKISVYSITHEFGHFVESKFIDEYNKQHIAEFLNMKTRALNAKSLSQSSKIMKDWEKKIGNNIAKELEQIAIKNNPNFKFKDNLSKYGYKNSLELFAESFANMECGKPNELGNAMKEFLKQKGML